jgi:hypothetical protein
MDNVNHPQHYGGEQNPYEVIKVLENWLTVDEYVGFLKGNVLKYEARARQKNGTEDYRKAAWYQDRLIKFLADFDEVPIQDSSARQLFWTESHPDQTPRIDDLLPKQPREPVAIHSNHTPFIRWGVMMPSVAGLGSCFAIFTSAEEAHACCIVPDGERKQRPAALKPRAPAPKRRKAAR